MVIRRVFSLTVAAVVACGGIALVAQGPVKEQSETVARPRAKKEAEAPKKEEEKIPSKFGKKGTAGDVPSAQPTFRSDATTVSVDVAVIGPKGNFIPGIPRAAFRVLEDGVPQQVSGFGTTEAPMTVCMVIEFSNLFQRYMGETWYQTLTAAYGFVETLKPIDYVAIVAYDMRAEMLSDFTTDRTKTRDALQRLRIPAFSETNLYDALTDTADRMSNIEGRKAIVLIASGYDSFSKLTFDKTRKMLQDSAVPIYAIGMMQALRERADARGGMSAIARLDFLQADNQMRTFATESGGQAFFPRFFGEFPGIFRTIHEAMRNQYSLAYQPTNQARDGKYRKIKVELVNPATGEPLRIVDEKGKPLKYRIIAKNGYTAPREVE